MSYRGFVKNRTDSIIDEFPGNYNIYYFEKPIFIDSRKILPTIKNIYMKTVNTIRNILFMERNYNSINNDKYSYYNLLQYISRFIGSNKIIGRVKILGQLPVLTFITNRYNIFERVDFLFRRLLVKTYINRIIETERESRIVAFACHPWWNNLIEYSGISLLCYDCFDDWRYYAIDEKMLPQIKLWHNELLAKTGLVFASSKKISSYIKKELPFVEPLIVPNGVDAKWFRSQAIKIPTPVDIKIIETPRIGYVGNIIFPWLDVEIIRLAAQELPNFNFVIVGWVMDNRLVERIVDINNIYFLGKKEYSDIPAYMQAFDVCLLPFKRDEKLDSNDTLIMYEYLSLGKPVVASKISEVEKVADLVYQYNNPTDFKEAVKKALEENDDQKRQKRIKYSLDNTWKKRAETIDKQIQTHLQGNLVK